MLEPKQLREEIREELATLRAYGERPKAKRRTRSKTNDRQFNGAAVFNRGNGSGFKHQTASRDSLQWGRNVKWLR